MSPEIIESSLGAAISTAIASIFGTILVMQKFRKNVIKDEADITSVQTYEKVMKLMREEFVRMQEQNASQQQQISSLQQLSNEQQKRVNDLINIKDEQQREFARQMAEQKKEFRAQIELLQAEITFLRAGRAI